MESIGFEIFDYLGAIHYVDPRRRSRFIGNSDGTTSSLEITFIQHEEGRYRPNGNEMIYEYNLTDHLGNTRITFGDADADGLADIFQENHYYPFGMAMTMSSTLAAAPPNNYLYNGKELQDELDLGWYDYGARMYDASIGRWNGVDALAEAGYDLSPYIYAFNNPIIYIDPTGNWSVSIIDNQLVFQMEEDDDVNTLASQLGLSVDEAKDLLDAEEGNNGQYSFGTLKTVQAVNTYLSGENLGKHNCANTCMEIQGEETNEAWGEGLDDQGRKKENYPGNGNPENPTSQATDLVDSRFEQVAPEQARIGDIVTYSYRRDYIRRKLLEGGQRSQFLALSLEQQEALIDKYASTTEHFSTVLLKDKTGNNISEVIHTPGELSVRTQAYSTSGSTLFTPNPTSSSTGTSPVYRKK